MKKLMFLMLVGVLVFGFMGGVLAESGSGDNESDEDNSGSSSESGDHMDDMMEEMEDEMEDEMEEMMEREEVRLRFENEGEENEIRIETRVGEDGEVEIKKEVTIKGIDEDGNEVEIELRIESREKDGEMFQKIKVKGYEVESESEVEIENETGKLKIKLSNGNFNDIKILPDVASMKAIENFESRDIKVELKEVGEGNEMRVVYEAEGNKTVKFLGLFKVKSQVRAVIDAESGELIDLDKPWWYFLAFGKGESDCGADSLGMCDGEDICVEAGMVWLNETCVAACVYEEKVCADNVTVVVRDEALGCEFADC